MICQIFWRVTVIRLNIRWKYTLLKFHWESWALPKLSLGALYPYCPYTNWFNYIQYVDWIVVKSYLPKYFVNLTTSLWTNTSQLFEDLSLRHIRSAGVIYISIVWLITNPLLLYSQFTWWGNSRSICISFARSLE